MRRLWSTWTAFRPQRAAGYAALCALGALVGLLLFLVCVVATALGRETVVDCLFPTLVLCAPVAALCVPLALVFGAFALITSIKQMPRRAVRRAYFALAVAFLALLMLGVAWRQPAPPRPVPPALETQRQFYAAQQARKAVHEIDWDHLRLFPPPQLSPRTAAQLREVKALYEVVNADTMSASTGQWVNERCYALGCINALLGKHKEAMRNFTQPYRVPIHEGARSVRDLWAEMAANLARQTPPCEVALLEGNREDAEFIATDPLAEAFFVRGQWREAVWRYERRLQVIYWRYRPMRPKVRYAPVPERVARSYERWAQEAKSPSLRRVLWERAAKAYTNAARYEPQRAGVFLHLKAGECWLRAGFPWRALVAFERVKEATKRDAPHPTSPARGEESERRSPPLSGRGRGRGLLEQIEQGRQQAESAIAKADGTLTSSRIAERLKKLMTVTKPFDDAERYYMAFDPDRAVRMLREFMKKCPDPNDPLLDDALWHICECTQSGVRYVRVPRRQTVWVTVRGKRTRRVMTWYTTGLRRRQPQSALPVLEELLHRFPQGDRAPEAVASIAQIHYYPDHPLKEVQSYLALLRQHPDAPVVPKVLTLMWKALQNLSRTHQPEKVLARLQLANDEEREALNNVLRFSYSQGFLFPFGQDYAAAVRGLSQVNLTTNNRLLRSIADVSLGITPKPLSFAAFACGKAFYLQGDWKNAEKQFRKVLAHPDVYNYHGWARYRLARCLENQGKCLDALRELAQVDFLESNTPLESSSPVSAARWRINFILDVKLSRAQLEATRNELRDYKLSAEWELAMIARDLRDERLRDAARRIENFVVSYPHHPQARALFARLCQLERHLIPTIEISKSQIPNPKSQIPNPKSQNLKPKTQDPEPVVAWVRWLLYAQSDFKRRVRLNLSGRNPMDDAVFALRPSPFAFRSQRVLHRLINRLSYHVRFYLAYGGPPDAERCDFDHAFYYARHPLALKNTSGAGFNADVAFLGRWGMAFDPWDENPSKRWTSSDARAAEDYVSYADSRIRAGILFDQFAARYPKSRLVPRALLMALQSHERTLAVTRQAAENKLFFLPAAWQTVFQHAKHDFTLLRANYRGSREERLAAPSRCRCQEMKNDIWLLTPEAHKSGVGLIARYWQGVYLLGGVYGSYFKQADFDLTSVLGPPLVTRIEGPVNHPTDFDSSWHLQQRSPRFAALDMFVGEWTGFIQIPSSGTYGFGTLSDDDSYVWIDGKMVVSNGGLHDPLFRSGSIPLTAGRYRLKIRYAEQWGQNVLVFKWRPPGSSEWRIVPMKNLSH